MGKPPNFLSYNKLIIIVLQLYCKNRRKNMEHYLTFCLIVPIFEPLRIERFLANVITPISN